MPFPRRTKQQFWLARCLPTAETGLDLRVTVGEQDTSRVVGHAQGLKIHFELAPSVLEEYMGGDWVRQLRADGYAVTEPQGREGENDQVHLVAQSAVDAEVLLRWLEPLMGMAVLNLRLMRRSVAAQPEQHCPQLVDAALAYAEVAFEAFDEGEDD